jgi:hypothetical protein
MLEAQDLAALVAETTTAVSIYLATDPTVRDPGLHVGRLRGLIQRAESDLAAR